MRDCNECEMLPFNSWPVMCDLPYTAVAEVIHAKGEHYTFDQGKKMWPWCWLDMVAQMTDDSIRELLGEDGRGQSRGLTNCTCEPRPNSYDHKRHYAIKKRGYEAPGRLPIWDFVIKRTDGTKIRLHPQWKGTDIQVFEPAEGTPEMVPAPAKGIGESDGPGTFQRFERAQTTGWLKFDPKKQPHKEGGSRGAGTQAEVAEQPPPPPPAAPP